MNTKEISVMLESCKENGNTHKVNCNQQSEVISKLVNGFEVCSHVLTLTL